MRDLWRLGFCERKCQTILSIKGMSECRFETSYAWVSFCNILFMNLVLQLQIDEWILNRATN